MFGLDDRIAALGTGESLLIVLAVAVLLGLRHATDPDHLTAVSTLLAGDGEEGTGARRAGRLGLVWGAGHATTLFLFGSPIVLFDSYLPEPVQSAAEVAVGVVIIALAIRLLGRWRRGALSPVHSHPHGPGGAPLRTRSPLQAYGIGLVHGIGGSAGVGLLLLAAIPDHVEGVLALAVFAGFTAVSMALASTLIGHALARGRLVGRMESLVPVFGCCALLFAAWYGLAALETVAYPF